MKLKKLCSKEKIGRLLAGLVLLLLSSMLIFLGIIPRLIGLLIGIYLIITALMGFCILYSVIKDE